jgi:ubiquinone/menaquinone biosynthesis C-methylase UbiE
MARSSTRLTLEFHLVTDDLLWQHLKDLPYFRALLRAVEARFYANLTLGEPVLDLGCGDGHFASLALAGRTSLVGVDPGWSSLTKAAQRGVYRHALQCLGAQLPFASGCFNTVISNSVLEHIPDVDAVLIETARVLRPGGTLIFCSQRTFSLLISLQRCAAWLQRLGEAYENFQSHFAPPAL